MRRLTAASCLLPRSSSYSASLLSPAPARIRGGRSHCTAQAGLLSSLPKFERERQWTLKQVTVEDEWEPHRGDDALRTIHAAVRGGLIYIPAGHMIYIELALQRGESGREREGPCGVTSCEGTGAGSGRAATFASCSKGSANRRLPLGCPALPDRA